MARDKNSCNVHLNWDETRLVRDIFEILAKNPNNKHLLDNKNFVRIFNRTKNACINQDEYPAKMEAIHEIQRNNPQFDGYEDTSVN